jgi:hypothetical protein
MEEARYDNCQSYFQEYMECLNKSRKREDLPKCEKIRKAFKYCEVTKNSK